MLVLALFAFVQINVVQVGPYQHAGAMRSNQHQSFALLTQKHWFSRAMFDGHYKEKEASIIPVPNISFRVFESMMRAIYTSKPCNCIYRSALLVVCFSVSAVCFLC